MSYTWCCQSCGSKMTPIHDPIITFSNPKSIVSQRCCCCCWREKIVSEPALAEEDTFMGISLHIYLVRRDSQSQGDDSQTPFFRFCQFGNHAASINNKISHLCYGVFLKVLTNNTCRFFLNSIQKPYTVRTLAITALEL